MKNGTKVEFSWPLSDVEGHRQHGTGEVLVPLPDGRLLVAQDPEGPEGRHFVIACAETWLTEQKPKATEPTADEKRAVLQAQLDALG